MIAALCTGTVHGCVQPLRRFQLYYGLKGRNLQMFEHHLAHKPQAIQDYDMLGKDPRNTLDLQHFAINKAVHWLSIEAEGVPSASCPSRYVDDSPSAVDTKTMRTLDWTGRVASQ